MDFGDIVRLIIFGLIFLSFFSGIFDRRRKGKGTEEPKPPRPREISQSGGQDRPVASRRQRPARSASTRPQTTDARREARDDVEAERRRRRQPLPPVATVDLEGGVEDVRASERELLEHDLTDMPSPMDIDPERRKRRERGVPARTLRRHPATGGDVLRGSLKDPDTLERAFIVKEVLDRPLALRDDR